MEAAAKELKKENNIIFKFVEYGQDKVIIQASQSQKHSGNYFTTKQLIEVTRKLFGAFFGNKKIHVQPIPYLPSKTDQVNQKWVLKKMLETGKTVNTISNDTGIDRSELKQLINGELPFTKTTKAFFYYYFCFIEKSKS